MTNSPYAAAPAPQPPARKKKKWPWIVAGSVVAIVAIAAAASGGTPSSRNETPAATGAAAGNDTPAAVTQPPAPTKHTVVYKVAGSSKTASSITYTTDGMTTGNQESNVKLPWTKTIELPTGEALQMVSLLAQGSGKGTIDVTIEVDGKLYKESHADGHGIAHANGNIGDLDR